jgi:hypothetical protein
MIIQNNARPTRQAGSKETRPNPAAPAAVNKVAWPEPPAQTAANKVAWPDPPAQTAANNVAWPDPPAQTAANNVAWPDPPSPRAVDKAAWPDPPSPVRGGARDVAAENTRAAIKTPEEEEKHTQEVPTNSIERTGNDAEPNRYVAEPKTWLVAQNDMPMSMLLAFGIGLVFAGLVVRRVVRVAFARRPTVRLERREAVLSTGVKSDDAVHLDNNVKESLRKLLKVLEQQTA